jgi:hypothetical protein
MKYNLLKGFFADFKSVLYQVRCTLAPPGVPVAYALAQISSILNPLRSSTHIFSATL